MTRTKAMLAGTGLVCGITLALAPAMLGGCKTDTQTGALVGAGGGAAIGALIYHSNPWAGALIGAAGGGLVGGLIGKHMDSVNQDMQKQLAPEVNAGQITMQTLPGNAIQVGMTWDTAFPTGSAVINPSFIPTLQKIGAVVGKYGKMTVAVIGYPDANESVQTQQKLSFDRAEAVRDQLIALGVQPVLVTATGNPGNPVNDGRVQIILTPIVSS